MIWIRPGSWFLSRTRWFTYHRIYLRWGWIPFEYGYGDHGHWTPFVVVTWPGVRVTYIDRKGR